MHPFGRSPSFICALVLSGLVIFSGSIECRADDRAKTAFNTADIGFQVITNTNRNDFHRYWTSGPGLEGYVLTPFYLGEFQLGVRVISFEGRPDELTDYSSVFMYAGWGLSWALPMKMTMFTGLNIGSDQMIFDFENRPGSKHESEFVIDLTSRLRVPVHGRWAVTAAGSYSEILTRHRIRLVFVSVGLSRSFDLPACLSEFLK